MKLILLIILSFLSFSFSEKKVILDDTKVRLGDEYNFLTFSFEKPIIPSNIDTVTLTFQVSGIVLNNKNGLPVLDVSGHEGVYSSNFIINDMLIFNINDQIKNKEHSNDFNFWHTVFYKIPTNIIQKEINIFVIISGKAKYLGKDNWDDMFIKNIELIY